MPSNTRTDNPITTATPVWEISIVTPIYCVHPYSYSTFSHVTHLIKTPDATTISHPTEQLSLNIHVLNQFTLLNDLPCKLQQWDTLHDVVNRHGRTGGTSEPRPQLDRDEGINTVS